MATSVAIVGRSGSGKTTSLRSLNPDETFIINADKKSLAFKGWKDKYSVVKKNYAKTSSIDQISKLLDIISKEKDQFKTVVIDTLNACMLDDEMQRMKEKGYDKWIDLSMNIYSLINYANSMREDLIVIFMFHEIETRDDSGYVERKILTNGRKLEKIVLESKFPIVLFTSVEGENGNNEFNFETRSNKSTAKSPLGMFEDYKIPNDLNLVINAIKNYEKGEDDENV